jgi:hypothetical protein
MRFEIGDGFNSLFTDAFGSYRGDLPGTRMRKARTLDVHHHSETASYIMQNADSVDVLDYFNCIAFLLAIITQLLPIILYHYQSGLVGSPNPDCCL